MAQFHNLLIYMLLGAAVIAGAMGHGVDTAAILGVVLANAVIGFVQEGKAEDALTLVAMEVFYLFSVRYLRASSFTLGRLFNSRAVLIAVATVVALQLLFTYAPVMERFFGTRPVDFVHGLEILALGLALFAILELEKRALRHRRAKRGERQ